MKRTDILIVIFVTTVVLACARPETPSADQPSTASTVATASVETPTETASPEQVLTERLVGYYATNLDGSTYRLSDQKGKVLLVNAWATWCGPCRYEIPELKRLHQEYADDGLEIVGVSVDMGAAEPSVRQFVDVNAIEYPILLDPQSRLTAMLRTTSIPTSVMLDREGNVVWRHIGIVSEQRDESFREALSKALGS